MDFVGCVFELKFGVVGRVGVVFGGGVCGVFCGVVVGIGGWVFVCVE